MIDSIAARVGLVVPTNIPRIEFEQPFTAHSPSVKSPKSVAFPVVEIVTNSIASVVG